ncbi:hypothetical protein RSWS8N_03610 [Cereibacter sphaeroides WS8N]|jgi:hypothetical protein|uniref:hypothetical protein n=1 Tax=Cereibacter sphaeroides TaxID=1063 RepID=UPI0000663C82|nr:hypothetical protein [Cereibacter sphaeroides]ABN76446.1 hypothetical protein Rsph17029_1336 [Cereibacter sphaeroides ATCC 17029]EGJ21134.1 hypothetical protein RSWS8N_03610 [Cereibacter sphaeroides WS8N]SNS22324.1 hypothetical protein SAMN05421763_101455 [[Luteovulum] sphaeroides subsp. megalophilum]
MTDLTSDTIEGRLIAQRKVLARLVALAGSDALRDWLDERSTMQDHQEDPGAVPAPGIAIEVALAEEIRCIRDEADRLRDGIAPG